MAITTRPGWSLWPSRQKPGASSNRWFYDALQGRMGGALHAWLTNVPPQS